MSHIVSRAVYPASQLKTMRFMEENSSICGLTGFDINILTKDRLYGISQRLYNGFRTLKTDLDLRPIFHKTDQATQVHLHLGLLAYWIVSTVRYQLQQKNIKSEWREIVRVMDTQKCVTTIVQNTR